MIIDKVVLPSKDLICILRIFLDLSLPFESSSDVCDLKGLLPTLVGVPSVPFLEKEEALPQLYKVCSHPG